MLAVGLVIAIAVLLTSFDGKPVPDWGPNLNLNAVLALLSTILRAMLVVVVAQIICQKKWDWYREKSGRRLRDLQKFDSGSRSTLGALYLIPTVVFRDTITLVAATVLLSSFLIGPFVQQASRTAVCTFVVQNSNASLPFAHYVPRRLGFTHPYSYVTGTPTPDTIVAVLSSVTAPNGTENQITGSCTTGNCTFPDGDPIDSASQNIARQNLADKETTSHSTTGVCSACVDVASLISSKKMSNASNTMQRILPNGFNVSYFGGGSTFALVRPTKDLTWLGDLLTPEIKAMSRWAYVNATFLAQRGENSTTTAAVCVLYPCLRTYIASITNNQLSERLIRSEVMQLDMTGVNENQVEYVGRYNNALSNFNYNYAAVKSPCGIDGGVYEISQNMSPNPGATTLSLVDFNSQGRSSRNITAPERCIYRQNSQFAMAISAILDRDIFDGICDSYKGPTCYKPVSPGQSTSNSMLTNLGVGTVLRTLIEGNASFSNVTGWFDSFADAMTNRFRFEYGAATFNATDRNLPLGEIHGLAWQDMTCVSLYRNWLLLPIGLTLITAILAIWTIAMTWRHRHRRPIWKDSLFPLILYGHRIVSNKLGTVPNQPYDNDADGYQTGLEKHDGLLEIHEMNDIGRKTSVKSGWPDHPELNHNAEKAAIPLQQERSGGVLYGPSAEVWHN
jgi:hypothetical protein